MVILIINIFFGFFFVGLGFLAKAYPDVIAGYNTMPKEKKKNVDIVGLSTLIKRVFIKIGITMIILSLLFKLCHFEDKYSYYLSLFVIVSGTLVIFIKSQKYDGNSKKNNKLK